MLSPRVILNIDAGEYPDEPEALYGVAELVHIACGGHAGDDESMDAALKACARFGARVGAHPSYVDRARFGRVALDLPPEVVSRDVAAQIARLVERALLSRQVVRYVKPHGALYHAANRDENLARAIVSASASVLGRAFALVGPPQGQLRAAAVAAGIGYLREGFADRRTREDGTLVPRGEPGALIEDPGLARSTARDLARSGEVDTVCVHSDTPDALLVARAARSALDALADR